MKRTSKSPLCQQHREGTKKTTTSSSTQSRCHKERLHISKKRQSSLTAVYPSNRSASSSSLEPMRVELRASVKPGNRSLRAAAHPTTKGSLSPTRDARKTSPQSTRKSPHSSSRSSLSRRESHHSPPPTLNPLSIRWNHPLTKVKKSKYRLIYLCHRSPETPMTKKRLLRLIVRRAALPTASLIDSRRPRPW